MTNKRMRRCSVSLITREIEDYNKTPTRLTMASGNKDIEMIK